MQTKNSGLLYVVATPIGNLADINQRAITTLRTVDYIAAEDTRHSRKLLDHYGITTPMLSLHEHNEQQRSQQILDYLQQGKSIALISDAGTPLISDPGFHLIQLAHAQGYLVSPIPGACALIAALSASGLATERFAFEGFLPSKTSARRQRLTELTQEPRTLIFYEAPHRILDLIADLQQIFGGERLAVIARELTKTFETIRRDTLAALNNWLNAHLEQQKGEFVVLVAGCDPIQTTEDKQQTYQILNILLTELPVKQAVQLATKITGASKNELYKYALEQKK